MTSRACREVPGIRAQTIRAASSIAVNIAEGFAKPNPELRRYLEMSLGSLFEVETHLRIAAGTGILSKREHASLQDQLDIMRKMLIKFIAKVRAEGEG
jgi:four helix bundle protein